MAKYYKFGKVLKIFKSDKFTEKKTEKFSYTKNEDRSYLNDDDTIENYTKTSDEISSIRDLQCKKDDRRIDLIRNALNDNDFISNYIKDYDIMNDIIGAMRSEEYSADSYIIDYDNIGMKLFVSETGFYESIKNCKTVKTFGPGVVFGEKAILYENNSENNIRAVTMCRVWTLEKYILQEILSKNKLQITKVIIQLLSNVIDFKGLNISDLTDVTKYIERRYFPAGEIITSSSGKRNLLYVITAGAVVFRNKSNTSHEHNIKERRRGDYFNEQLLNIKLKPVSIFAKDSGAECLIIEPELFNKYLNEKIKFKNAIRYDIKRPLTDKKSFIELKTVQKLPEKITNTPHIETSENEKVTNSIIKNQSENDSVDDIKESKRTEINDNRMADDVSEKHVSKSIESPKSQFNEFNYIQLNDLIILGTLGVGGFGRVELVQYTKDPNQTFALKCIKKVQVINENLERHVFNERDVMHNCKSPFIVTLYNTYKDDKFVYYLLEPILGGDVWNLLYNRGKVKEKTAKFITACVVEALEYLSNHDIIYRDIKPENLMLDNKGYVKLIDFGYAKYLRHNEFTNTITGTPEYMAPEIILGINYDRAVDYWSLGILVYELTIGKSPFKSHNIKLTYEMILKGIEHADFSMFPNVTSSLIRKLCNKTPEERLGYSGLGIADIKSDRWFQNFDWDSLKQCKLKAPLILPVKNNRDRRHFHTIKREKLPPDETSGWDKDF